MAQEDKGLIVRGLLLLAGIGTMVTIVLVIILWRAQPEQTAPADAPERVVPWVILPSLAPFPASVSWHAVQRLAEAAPSAPGHDIRYNAAATLARRGSSKVPWSLIREMLDEKLQMRNNRVRLPDGAEVYDESAARAHMIVALRALAAWHEKQPDKKAELPSDLRALYPIVDRLADTSTGELQAQANLARATFFR